MNSIKLGAVIVTYNPTNHILNLINNIMRSVDIIVIVDNNSKNNINNLINDKDGIIKIINNKKNMGLSTALNIGVEYLMNIKYKYALLLDQDSFINDSSILYLKETISKENCGLVGPQIHSSLQEGTIKSTFLVKNKLGFKKVFIKDNELLEVMINITSGSIINIKTWDEVGRFWDELFIEGIDDEYCLRLGINNYKVLIDARAILYQKYGNIKKVKKLGLTWYPTFHSPVRLYLLYRNKILIIKKYLFVHKSYVIFQVLSLIKRFITIIISENERKIKIKSIYCGIIDGIRGNKGYIKDKDKI